MSDKKAIEKIEQLENKVIVYFNFSNGMHIPDERKNQEILYNSISRLQLEPNLNPNEGESCDYTEYWREEFKIDKLDKTLAFHFQEWQETVSSRMQSVVGGPYIVGYKKQEAKEPFQTRGGCSFDMNPNDPNRPCDLPDGH